MVAFEMADNLSSKMEDEQLPVRDYPGGEMGNG